MRTARNISFAILLVSSLVALQDRTVAGSYGRALGDVCSECDCVFVWPDYILVQCANHYDCTETYPDFCSELWGACGRYCPGGIWSFNCQGSGSCWGECFCVIIP